MFIFGGAFPRKVYSKKVYQIKSESISSYIITHYINYNVLEKMDSFVPEYLSVRLLRVDTFGEPRVEFRHVDSAVRNAVLVLPLIDLNKKVFLY